jgi:DNA repair protein RecO (recombination protein O)
VSSADRPELVPAYLLSVRPLRETSLLVEAWTRSHGRVGLVARGARGPKSRRRALLQSLQPLLLSWTQRGELGTLVDVESSGPARVLKDKALLCAWYLNELLVRLIPRQDPHPVLFDAYETALHQLSESMEPTLRTFEMSLLCEAGYGLWLPDTLESGQDYLYDWEAGPVEAEPGVSGSFPGEHLIALRDGRLETQDQLRSARHLLRAALARQLGDRPLRTVQLFRALQPGAPVSGGGAVNPSAR